MLRSTLALILLVLFAVAAFGVRTAVQKRRHGDSGWRFSRPSGVAAITHILLAVAIVLAVSGPLVALAAGAADRPLGLRAVAAPGTAAGWVGLVVGLAACLAGAAMTLVAQQQMGASWRIGVDPGEQTSLVTAGLFRYVRNPIFTGMGLFVLGEALLVPNVVMLGALVSALIGLHGQVRLVEEPYLTSVHGTAYREWAAHRGRFVPGIGRTVC